MDSLKLEGTTIRGLVKGRPVNCIVRSVPDGLALPPGQYLLRGENNPIYGQLISIESAFGPGGLEQVGIHFKMPPAVVKDSPSFHFEKMPPTALKDAPAAIATLVPAKPAYSAILKEVPGVKMAPASLKDAPASKIDAPTSLKYAPASKIDAPASLKDAPASLKYVPSSKVDAPGVKIEAPAAKFDAPAAKYDAPSAKFDAASAKFYVPGQGMTARVIIAIRPIGQNSLVAQAGFSDLVDAVQQAGGVTLIVS